jgi:hypothetical protein
MKKQCILIGILAASFYAVAIDARAQETRTPKEQPPQAAEPAAPTGDLALGTVRLPKGVTADGKPLPAGSYQVRLTSKEAGPPAVGISENLERWVEFVQGGSVKGSEVVSIVPQAEVKNVVKDAPPASGASKVQTLKGNDYVRVWINRAGNHYLIHLPVSGAAAPAVK